MTSNIAITAVVGTCRGGLQLFFFLTTHAQQLKEGQRAGRQPGQIGSKFRWLQHTEHRTHRRWAIIATLAIDMRYTAKMHTV